MKQLVGKYREKRKGLYIAFMDLEKACDEVCREELWRVLNECRIDGSLIRSVSSLYGESSIYVRLGSIVKKYFEVRYGMIQGCLIFSWLFNISFD